MLEREESSELFDKIGQLKRITRGEIVKFEVKYREKFLLTKEETKKYLKRNDKPYIFLLSKHAPYLIILGLLAIGIIMIVVSLFLKSKS